MTCLKQVSIKNVDITSSLLVVQSSYNLCYAQTNPRKRHERRVDRVSNKKRAVLAAARKVRQDEKENVCPTCEQPSSAVVTHLW